MAIRSTVSGSSGTQRHFSGYISHIRRNLASQKPHGRSRVYRMLDLLFFLR
jgi:hypothetical protein